MSGGKMEVRGGMEILPFIKEQLMSKQERQNDMSLDTPEKNENSISAEEHAKMQRLEHSLRVRKMEAEEKAAKALGNSSYGLLGLAFVGLCAGLYQSFKTNKPSTPDASEPVAS